MTPANFAVLLVAQIIALETAGAGQLPAPASTVIDGIDAGCVVATGTYYNFDITWWGIPYTPALTYALDRIEFVHGQRSVYSMGTVVFQVRPDSAGTPSTRVLTAGQNALLAAVSWQGGDVPPTRMNQGQNYWIALKPVPGSQASTGDLFFSCTRYPWYKSQDGIHWTPGPPTNEIAWMVRFYGTPVTAVQEETWARVKSLYR